MKGRFLRFAVFDNGLGIPMSEQTRIFEKFYRLDPDMTRGIGGTGLGLYICRELVRRVDGRLWVESREGTGSTFNVENPACGRSCASQAGRADAQRHCCLGAGGGTRTHGPRFTKPLLYQLSYSGARTS